MFSIKNSAKRSIIDWTSPREPVTIEDMEISAPKLLTVGDEVSCVVVKSRGGKRFEVKCPQAPRNWTVELHSREPGKIREGIQYTCWVARITPLKSEVLLHEGRFGKMPISPSMQPRYVSAVDALLGEEDLTAEALGEATSMLSRIGTQNQPDWLTVWKVLGEPPTGEIKELIQGIHKLKAARKEAPDDLPKIQAAFLETFGYRLKGTKRRLSKAVST